MRRLALVLMLALSAVAFTACSQCLTSDPVPASAAAPVKSRVYTPVCTGGNYDRPAGDEIYTPSDCNAFEELGKALGEIQPPWQSIADSIAGTCPGPQVSFTPVAAAPVCAPPAVAASNPGHCGPLPPQAKVGEVWCCVWVQPAAAAPEPVCVCEESCREEVIPATYETVTERVQVAPARVEWRPVECGSDSCWTLVEVPAVFEDRARTVMKTPASTRTVKIPARYEMRASAPPGYWEWQLNPSCAPAAAPASGSLPLAPAAAACASCADCKR